MSSNSRCTCHNTLVVKNLNRWFKEKWVDVSRKDPKTGKHPPCGRSKAKLSGKGYPKCRPSVKVSSKTPKTSGSMSSGQKRAATRRKRAKKQGVGGKPTIVKGQEEQDFFDQYPGLSFYQDHVVQHHPAFDSDPDFGGLYEDVGAEVMGGGKLSDRKYADNTRSLGDRSAFSRTTMNPQVAAILDRYARRTNYKPKITHMNDLLYQNPQEPKNRLDYLNYMSGYFPDDAYSVGGYMTVPIGVPGYETGDAYDDRVYRSEPMDIAFQLLKRQLSPEARRHKLEYDKKYESSPERVKYREELNQERRRRGIYGSGDHKDVSHTQGGRLTLEGEHSNRARHFKNRGTLRVVKQQRYDVGDDAPCPACYGRGMLPEYADDEDEDPTCEACNGSGLMLDAMENSRFTRPRAGSSRDATE